MTLAQVYSEPTSGAPWVATNFMKPVGKSSLSMPMYPLRPSPPGSRSPSPGARTMSPPSPVYRMRPPERLPKGVSALEQKERELVSDILLLDDRQVKVLKQMKAKPGSQYGVSSKDNDGEE